MNFFIQIKKQQNLNYYFLNRNILYSSQIYQKDATPKSDKDDRQSQLDFETKSNINEIKTQQYQTFTQKETLPSLTVQQTNTRFHQRSDTTTGLQNNTINTLNVIQHPLNSPITLQQITLQKSTDIQQYPDEENQDEVCNQYRRFFFESENHVQHCYKIEDETKQKQSSHCILENPKISRRQSIKENRKLKRQETIRIKKERNNDVQVRSFAYLQSVPKFKGICMFHDFFQIFITYNKKKSRFYRISIFYNQLIWLLTLTSIFGNTLSIAQVIALSIVSSIIFGILRVVLKYILRKKKLKIIGYILTFSFLIFCYYSIFATIGSQNSTDSNGWVINYGISQTIDFFITGGVFSVIKYYCTLILLPKISISNIIYKFMNADAIFGIFK